MGRHRRRDRPGRDRRRRRSRHRRRVHHRVEGTSIATATTLAAGETIIGAGAAAAGAGGAAAAENAAETEGGVAAAVVEAPPKTEPDSLFFRFGKSWESQTRLTRQATAAESAEIGKFKITGLHGVSVSLTTPGPDKEFGGATRQAIEDAGFGLVYTPTTKDTLHHTLTLPKPITPEVVKLFNELFGRTK